MEIYEITCSNGKCNFTSELSIGWLMTGYHASGYCVKCDKFADVYWPLELDETPVNTRRFVGKVWDAATSRAIRLFRCPKCRGPFAEIEEIEDLKFCPRCASPDPSAVLTILAD